MTIRFFILMAHYRSTVDFSSEALEAAEKGLTRMQEAYSRLMSLKADDKTTIELPKLEEQCREAMDDDLNSPIVISHLFDSARVINTIYDGKATISSQDLTALQSTWKTYVVDILGLRMEDSAGADNSKMNAYKGAVDMLLNIRQQAKQEKDWEKSDYIRNRLTALGFAIKDKKDGFEWSL